MLSEFVSANTRIAQIVWLRIPHQWTNHRESQYHETARSRRLADRSCCCDAWCKV